MGTSFSVSIGRSFLLRVEYGEDIVQFLAKFSEKNEIAAATFTAIGALKSAKLGFYDQEKHEYREELLSTPQEIACCVGNISIKENKPFIHSHAALTNQKGNTHGGHLLEGKVFAAEIHLTELLGARIVRKNDATTGLSLWL